MCISSTSILELWELFFFLYQEYIDLDVSQIK